MIDLKDKVAIVTGASAGIGAAIVKVLLKLGIKVVGVARRKEKIEALGKGYAEQLFAFKADITQEQEILDCLRWTQENVGPVYLLVNNAGISYPTPLIEADSEVWRKTVDTNLVALALFTKETIKAMIANKIDGIIININSIAGHYYLSAIPGLNIYQACKFGVTAFTESVRLELAKHGSKIRISSMSPGLVQSEMTEDYLTSFPNYIKSEEIANGIKYIITQPPNVNIAELTIRPTGENL